MPSLDLQDLAFKNIKNVKITHMTKCNYIGMVCNETNKPHGYGRAIHASKKCFIDG